MLMSLKSAGQAGAGAAVLGQNLCPGNLPFCSQAFSDWMKPTHLTPGYLLELRH